MKGLHPDPQAPAEERENLRITNEVVDELYFKFRILPGAGVLGGGATIQPMGGNSAATIRFPNAATSYWIVNLPVRPRFVAHSYRLKTVYSTTAADANTFSCQTALWLTVPGGNLTTDPNFGVSFTLPGLGALNDTSSQTNIAAFPATPVAPFYDGMRFRFLRIDPDTAATSLDVLELVLTLYGRVS